MRRSQERRSARAERPCVHAPRPAVRRSCGIAVARCLRLNAKDQTSCRRGATAKRRAHAFCSRQDRCRSPRPTERSSVLTERSPTPMSSRWRSSALRLPTSDTLRISVNTECSSLIRKEKQKPPAICSTGALFHLIVAPRRRRACGFRTPQPVLNTVRSKLTYRDISLLSRHDAWTWPALVPARTPRPRLPRHVGTRPPQRMGRVARGPHSAAPPR